MSLKNVTRECLTQSAHVFVLGRPKSHKKNAQEKKNVNRAREFLRMLCHYEFTFPFFNENILLVHTISEMGGEKKILQKM